MQNNQHWKLVLLFEMTLVPKDLEYHEYLCTWHWNVMAVLGIQSSPPQRISWHHPSLVFLTVPFSILVWIVIPVLKFTLVLANCKYFKRHDCQICFMLPFLSQHHLTLLQVEFPVHWRTGRKGIVPWTKTFPEDLLWLSEKAAHTSLHCQFVPGFYLTVPRTFFFLNQKTFGCCVQFGRTNGYQRLIKSQTYIGSWSFFRGVWNSSYK